MTTAERLFAEHLAGEKLLTNRSIWRTFPTVRCGSWRHENVVLLGDSAHTAHFSIGSGTKLAMEDAIALADAVLSSARAAGCTTSLDLSSFEVVNASRAWLFGQFRRGIDIVFANEDEIRALFEDNSSPFDTLTRRLAGHGVLAAVKVGKDGAWIGQGEKLHRVEPRRVAEVVDTNGAGDAWAAGFLFAHLSGWPLPACGELASLMGAETVSHLGPIIPASHWPELHAVARALDPKTARG